MLVLTRKTGQKLLIGSNIEIKVLETHGDSVKFGITAPKNIAIYREELYLEICKANQAANQPANANDILTQMSKQVSKDTAAKKAVAPTVKPTPQANTPPKP